MILIASSNPHERAALIALCASRRWESLACDSVRAFRQLLRRAPPTIVLTRDRLPDGYSDDVISAVAGAGLATSVKTVVLVSAGATSAQQARQLALGAESVHRDPVRTDVLAEYLAKFLRHTPASPPGRTAPEAATQSFPFAGAVIQPGERSLHHRARRVILTPREVQLAEVLASHHGQVVTYQTLYREVFNVRFGGETSGMRVLLGKLRASFRAAGVDLDDRVEVIAKTGYRYTPPPSRGLRCLPSDGETNAA